MGALGTRHSLRPLLIEARTVLKNSGASRRGNAGSYLNLERRHCEERSDEAIHSSFARRDGLLRSARNDGLKAPLRLGCLKSNPGFSRTPLRGMPVYPPSPAVTTFVCTSHRTRGYGCIGHPALKRHASLIFLALAGISHCLENALW